MVIAAVWPLPYLCAAVLAAAAVETPAPPPGADPVASALAKGAYPWYDAGSDAIKPVKPPKRIATPAPQSKAEYSLLQLLIFLLVALILAGLMAAVVWAYHRRLLEEDVPIGPRYGPARRVARSGPLPTGLDTGGGDLMAEAARLRAAGNYSAALVHLFAHQLIALDRLRLLRLAPGRTGRQLVRSVSHEPVRTLIEPSLKLFEEVNYGRIPPTTEAFEAVWSRAQDLERLIAEGAVS